MYRNALRAESSRPRSYSQYSSSSLGTLTSLGKVRRGVWDRVEPGRNNGSGGLGRRDEAPLQHYTPEAFRGQGTEEDIQ
eukprot:12007365-Prorocentrum_lima.AAC.1